MNHFDEIHILLEIFVPFRLNTSEKYQVSPILLLDVYISMLSPIDSLLNVDLKKSYLNSKNRFIWDKQAIAKPQASPKNIRGMLFYGEKGASWASCFE